MSDKRVVVHSIEGQSQPIPGVPPPSRESFEKAAEDFRSRAMEALNPPSVAVELGHDLWWDPGMSSVSRWTCARCGRAALRSGTVQYGSATEERCEGSR